MPRARREAPAGGTRAARPWSHEADLAADSRARTRLVLELWDTENGEKRRAARAPGRRRREESAREGRLRAGARARNGPTTE
jgi:hypothetical protein